MKRLVRARPVLNLLREETRVNLNLALKLLKEWRINNDELILR